jgi:hypothetical protein
VKSWEARPFEIAYLMNPAFCGEILRRAIVRYFETAGYPFAYPLAYLVLPIVLHRKTRESISAKSSEQLHAWLQKYPEARIGFAERARFLVPITNESLAFLLQARAVFIDKHAGIRTVGRRSNSLPPDEHEVTDCFRKAGHIGRWFARAGSTANIFTMWGVKP